MTGDPCELLPWDSAHFGRPIARVRADRLDGATARAVLNWCAGHGVECLYLLADAADAETARAAAAHGFEYQDARMTYERKAAPVPALSLPPGLTCRPAAVGDLPALVDLAGGAFVDSRFWFDGRFPRPAVEALYRAWAARSLAEDAVLVVDRGGLAVGFVALRESGEIPLVGLSAGERGRGVGTALVAEALRWFERRGVGRVRYVTQGRNVSAQRVIGRLGFLLESTQVWYHRWFAHGGCRLAS